MTSTLTTTITYTTLRTWLQIDSTDYPVQADLTTMIGYAQTIVQQDTSTTTQALFDLLVLFKSSSIALKSLASRCIKNGILSHSTGLGSINKSPSELLKVASVFEEDYIEMVQRTVKDVGATSYMGALDTYTVQDFKDILQGVDNAWMYESKYRPSINGRTAYRGY